jgi:hypothetical protein
LRRILLRGWGRWVLRPNRESHQQQGERATHNVRTYLVHVKNQTVSN